MTIYVQRMTGGTLKIRDGRARLRASLNAFGYANVTDMETDEQFRVHEVNGQLVELTAPRAESAKTTCRPTAKAK